MVRAINDQRENPAYLPGLVLAEGLAATESVERALSGADLVVLAIPTQRLRGFVASILVLGSRYSVLDAKSILIGNSYHYHGHC